jgi:HSP20 family protein
VTVTAQRSSRPGAMVSARRSDPFREMEDLQDRMGQLMNGLFGLVSPTVVARLPMAPADIEEADDAYVVELDLPGVNPGDVDVEVRENELRVSGEIKEKERKGILRRQMRPVGQFEHVVALPGEVDPDKVEATLSDGVLRVRLGKSQVRKPRHVEIKSS